MLQPSDRSVFAQEMGLTTSGEVSRRGTAGLLRSALERWGLSPRRALTRYARQQLGATLLSDQPATFVDDVLSELRSLQECDEVSIGHERYVVAGYPRWIRTSKRTAALLGVDPVPAGLSVSEAPAQSDIVRRVRVDAERDFEILHDAGYVEWSFEAWLRPLNYMRHLRRRAGRLMREDNSNLRQLWDFLVQTVAAEGRPVSEEAPLRVLTGSPGSFFGKFHAPKDEGRWTTQAEDGVWCGYRKGYSDAHWYPVVVAIDGDERRIVDLYNHDEWRWAMLARAQATGVYEVIRESGDTVELTCPLPAQLYSAMTLLGPKLGAWTWKVPEGATRFWTSFV